METFADYQRYDEYLKSLEPKEIKGTAHPQDLEYYSRLLKRLKELQDYSGTKKWFVPGTYLSIDNYPRHKLFFDATRNYRQTMFMAGNRIGKTEAGAFAASSWATGFIRNGGQAGGLIILQKAGSLAIRIRQFEMFSK